MKNRMNKIFKKTFSLALVMAIIIVGFVLPADASYKEDKSDDTTVKTKYIEYSYDDFDAEKDGVPTYSNEDCPNGYLFGGWFTSEDEKTFNAMTSTEKAQKTSGVAYAKFVPAYVMGIKVQNQAGTTKDMSADAKTSLKVVSSIDTSNYDSVGFEMKVITLNADGTLKNQATIEDKKGLKNAYKKFSVYANPTDTQPVGSYSANDLFGNEAGFFTTWGVTEITTGDFDTIICIRPSWVTIDGTTVYGLTKYVRVNDGFLYETEAEGYYRYVNVPVNVRNTETGLAAGVLSVAYDSSKMELDSFEGGRVFEEMAYAKKTASIKMVGNVTDVSKNSVEDDIYANLRFKLSCTKNDEFTTFTDLSFEVTDEDFCNNEEKQYTGYDVWEIKY